MTSFRSGQCLAVGHTAIDITQWKDFPDFFPIRSERARKSFRFSKPGMERKFLSETSLSDILSDLIKLWKNYSFSAEIAITILKI